MAWSERKGIYDFVGCRVFFVRFHLPARTTNVHEVVHVPRCACGKAHCVT